MNDSRSFDAWFTGAGFADTDSHATGSAGSEGHAGGTGESAGAAGFTSTRWDGAVTAMSGLVDEAVGLSDGHLAIECLKDLQLAARRMDAARLHLVAVVDQTKVWATDGGVSAAAYLRHELGIEHGQAKSDLTTARVLADLPHLAGAFAAGKVSRAAVDKIIAVGTKNTDRRRLLPDFEEIFANVAATQPFKVLARTLAMWADQVDPLTTIDDEEAAFQRRYLNLTRLGDGWLVDGFLTLEQGTAVAAALNAVITATRRQASADPAPATDPNHPDIGSKHSDFGALADMPQNPCQARADALADLARLAASVGDLPETGGVKPTVVVTVPLARLTQDCTRGVTIPTTNFDPANFDPTIFDQADFDPTALFEDLSAFMSVSNGPGTSLISPITAQRLTCDCEIHRLVINPAGLPLDVGRKTRTIPTQIRIALNQRDKGCCYPGCDRPPAWREGHHIRHWSKGGYTALKNLALLCSRHHHTIHETGEEILMGTDGKPKIKRPAHRRGRNPKYSMTG